MIPKASIPRLTKMVLMLSSSNDGEALAAVRAIGRALEADGANWHDFAALISPGGSKVKVKVNGSHYTGPRPEPKPRYEPRPSTEYDYSIDSAMLFKTLMQATLTNWEREFVHSVYEQWKKHKRVTKKQADILYRLRDEKKAG